MDAVLPPSMMVFFTKWCNPPDLSYQQKKPLDLNYMYLRGEHWGMPLFRCWKVEIMQNTTPYPPTMLWPCLLNLVRLSCPNASSILGDTLSSPLNCDSCLEWYSFLSKSFLESFKRVLWVVVLLDQECLPQLQKKFKMKYIFQIRMFGCLTSFHLSAVLSPFACALSIASVLSLSIALLILQLQFKIGI